MEGNAIELKTTYALELKKQKFLEDNPNLIPFQEFIDLYLNTQFCQTDRCEYITALMKSSLNRLRKAEQELIGLIEELQICLKD